MSEWVEPTQDWCEGYMEGLMDAQKIVEEYFARVADHKRGGKATFYLSEVLNDIKKITG